MEGQGRQEHVRLDIKVRLPDQPCRLVAEEVCGSQLWPGGTVGEVQVALRGPGATESEVTKLSISYLLNLNRKV